MNSIRIVVNEVIEKASGNNMALLTGILPLIGVGINIFYTNKIKKEINHSNNKLQIELNQKNIDANLKSKARIEWIQKVRNTSAELIMLYNTFLNLEDRDKMLEVFLSSQEKTELLILFFGPEKQNSKVDIKNMESNDGKNELIVEFLSKLNKDIYLYYKELVKEKQENLKKIKEDRLSKMYQHIVDCCVEEVELEGGRKEINNEPILEPEYEKEIDEIEEAIEKCVKITNELYERIVELRNIIRIYLKIEWNKAKVGK